MAAPWACGSSSSCLQTQPWITSVIGSRVHLLKGVFAEDGYELLLWDSLSLWRERERLEDITHRMTVGRYSSSLLLLLTNYTLLTV